MVITPSALPPALCPPWRGSTSNLALATLAVQSYCLARRVTKLKSDSLRWSTRGTLVCTVHPACQPLRAATSLMILASGTSSQLPLRVVLPLPRMSLALPLITSVSGGPDTATSSTV
ncbi:hypothetical protein D3C78_1565430 [compost metagenome]